MIRLESILTPGRSLVNVPGGSKKKALEQIANLIAREVPDLEMQDVFEDGQGSAFTGAGASADNA